MTTPLFHIDAFTGVPFAGNPAAVCLLPDGAAPSDAWMQALAAELDLPATAFAQVGGAGWRLRWFTAVKELSLCGHATLATAHVLFNELGVESPELRFTTAAGILTARRDSDWIALDLPADTARPIETLPEVRDALGLPTAPAPEMYRGTTDLLVILPTADDVRGCRPDHPRLVEVDARVVIITAPAGGAVDFVSRVFGPSVGITEDPVTGSAHCLLGPYWAARLGTTTLQAHQASARGGDLRIEVNDDRVLVAGQAVTVARGSLADTARFPRS